MLANVCALDALVKEFTTTGKKDEQAWNKVYRECKNIIEASDMLLTSDENRPLVEEMTPWLYYFKQLGEYGCKVLEMVEAGAEDDEAAFVRAYTHAKALKKLMGITDASSNRDHRQPGVKCGTKRLVPAFDTLLESVSEK